MKSLYELLITKLERILGFGIQYLKTRVPLPVLLGGSGVIGLLVIIITIFSISGSDSQEPAPNNESSQLTTIAPTQGPETNTAQTTSSNQQNVSNPTAVPTPTPQTKTREKETPTAIPAEITVAPTPLPTEVPAEPKATPTEIIQIPIATPLLPSPTPTPSPVLPPPTQTPIPTPPSGLITSNQSISGYMPEGYDIHSFTFTGEPGRWISIAVIADSGDLDPFVSVRPPAGSDYSDDNGGGEKNSLITDIPMNSYEVYTINVSGYPETSGEYTITIQITESPSGGEGLGLPTATPPAGPVIALGDAVSHQATFNYETTSSSLTVTPDGARVYVTRPSLDDLIVVSVSDLQLLATISVGGNASAIDFSLDGSLAFVSVDSNPGRVVVIDTNPSSSNYHGIIGNLECSQTGAYDIKVHPDGNQIFITHSNGHLSFIQMPMPSRIGECLHFGNYGLGDLFDLAFSSDGTIGYAASSPSTTKHVLRFHPRIKESGFLFPVDLTLNNSLGGAASLAMSSAGPSPTLWVGDNGTTATESGSGFSVVKIIGNSMVKIKSERFSNTGGNAPDVCITPDGATAVILVRSDSATGSSMVIYDVASLQQIGTYNDTEDSVYSCAITPNGTHVFVTMGSGSMSKFELD